MQPTLTVGGIRNMWMLVLSLAGGLLLAFSNGANDNFKGVATLYGSRTTTYRRALAWGTITTACGSLFAIWFAEELLKRFSGKGMIADELVSQGEFGAAVALAAGMTVLLASRLGFPISTTHSLVGAMIGVAAASRVDVNWHVFVTALVAPLLISPLVAVAAAFVIYPIFHRAKLALGVGQETCVCAGQQVAETVPVGSDAMVLSRTAELSVSLGTQESCRQRYAGHRIGLDVRQSLDWLHFLSAGTVSFARGLNDTPKIAALLLVAPAFGSLTAAVLCGTAIAVGGWLGARRTAETLSYRITDMNAGQGFSANLVTTFLVTCASRWGLPVSTTHVSCGALFGIGCATGRAHWRSIAQILLAWITTLPCAAALAWFIFGVLA